MAKRKRRSKKRAPHRVGCVGVRWDGRLHREAWFLRWTDKHGKQRSRRAAVELVTALEAARELDRELTNERLGIRTADPMRVPVDEIQRDYLNWLLHRPASMKHVREIESILTRAFTGLVPGPGGVRYVAQVRRRDVERYLDRLADGSPNDPEDEGLSGRTLNKHLTALKALFAWAVREERIPSSPLAGLQSRPQFEKRVRRQALKPDGLEAVLRAAKRRGARSWEHIAYCLGCGAGLRAGDVRALRWCDVDLHPKRSEGTYTIHAERQKGHKDTIVPFRPELVEILRAWRASLGEAATPESALVPGFPENPVTALRATLEVAGLPYRNAAGEVCDFHALRHSFITNLGADASIRLEVKQLLARHADIKTTRGYDHTGLTDMRDAVEKLPTVSGRGCGG